MAFLSKVHRLLHEETSDEPNLMDILQSHWPACTLQKCQGLEKQRKFKGTKKYHSQKHDCMLGSKAENKTNFSLTLKDISETTGKMQTSSLDYVTMFYQSSPILKKKLVM